MNRLHLSCCSFHSPETLSKAVTVCLNGRKWYKETQHQLSAARRMTNIPSSWGKKDGKLKQYFPFFSINLSLILTKTETFHHSFTFTTICQGKISHKNPGYLETILVKRRMRRKKWRKKSKANTCFVISELSSACISFFYNYSWTHSWEYKTSPFHPHPIPTWINSQTGRHGIIP